MVNVRRLWFGIGAASLTAGLLLAGCTQQEEPPEVVEEKPGVVIETPAAQAATNPTPAASPAVTAAPVTGRPLSPAASPSPAAATGPLTAIPYDQPQQLAQLAGRQVDITTRVQSVPSDRTFWIGPNENQWIPILMNDETQTPGSPTEGVVDVNPGQIVHISGEIREMPPPGELQEQYDIPESELETFNDLPAYIFAESVEVVEQ